MSKVTNVLLAITTLGLLLVSLILAVNSNNSVPTQEQKNTIQVSGTYELSTAPDKAEIYLSIITTAESAEDAKDENAKINEDVTDALKEIGVTEDDIETTNFNLYKKEEWNPETRASEEKGYELRNTIRITTEKLADVGKIVDTGINNGANGIDRVEFGLTKEQQKEAQSAALEKASKAAKEKAGVLAASLSLKLGDIVTVSESNANIVPYNYYNNFGAMAVREEAASAISPENVAVRATVGLVYEIG